MKTNYTMSIKRNPNGEVIAELNKVTQEDKKTICSGKIEAVADVFIDLAGGDEGVVEVEAQA